MQVSPTSFSFLERTGDNSLKQHHSFLESPLARNFFPRNPNMGAANYILYHSKIQKAIYCIYYLNYLFYLSMLSACYIFVCIFMSICPPNIRIGTLRHLKFYMKEQVTCSNCYSLVMHLPSLMTVKTLPHVREHRTITLDGHAKHWCRVKNNILTLFKYNLFNNTYCRTTDIHCLRTTQILIHIEKKLTK